MHGLRPEDFAFGRLLGEMREPLVILEATTGRIILWNSAAERVFEYSAAEIIGENLEILFAEPARSAIRTALARFAETRAGSGDAGWETLSPVRMVSRSGTELAVEVSLGLVERATVEGRYVVALVHDVTERLRAQKVIEERTAELKERSDLLDLVQDAIFVRDFRTGAIRYWNRGAERLYGWSAPEVLGVVSRELLRTRFPEPLEAIEAAVAQGGRWDGELVHTSRAGQQLMVSSRWALQRDAQGEASAILEVNTDITERKMAEERLREQAALLDLAPDAIFVRELGTGQIRFWNRGAEVLYGWTAAEAIGASSHALLQSRFPRPLAELEAELQATGLWEGEVQHHTRDGRRLTVASRWALRRGDQDRPRDILVTNTDISQRKQAEAELARLAAADAALRERDQLLATVSHDLKTPLTAIRGQADILLRQIDLTRTLEPERARRGLELVRTAAVRMGTWIDDLLDTARLQAGRPLELHREPMDLVALAWQAAAEHQRSTQRHRLRVETTEPKLVGVWDPIRLRRVLDNLLSNAVKYSPDGGEVIVTVALQTGPTGPAAALAVQDHGVGIPASDVPHVFERFGRAGNVVGRFGGTGIGLAGAYQIVHEHGGRIEVQSEEGRGTTFTVHLPLVVGDEGSEQAA